MHQSTKSSESTITKKEEPLSNQERWTVEYQLAEVLKEHRKGLTYLAQAKSIIRALPEHGLRIQAV